ncbi:MAG: hypothetical protein K2F72_05385, partial [Muribaculaceae bacterium]|nr:hypothetical protein [Muribaculaceae bacterium]
LFIATIANEDKLTGVQVNGTDVNYILNNGQLYITLPGTCGKNTTVTLVSSNGEISYTYDVIPATHQERVIMSTPMTIGNWDEPRIFIMHEQLADVPEGAKLVFYTDNASSAQLQLNDANWSSYTILDIPAGEARVEFELTAEALEFFSTNNGYSDQAIIIQGSTCTVNKITVEWEISLEETIWSGEWECSGWNGNQDLAWGGFDWTTVKPGSMLRVYITPTKAEGEWWCLSLRHGDNWGNLPGNVGAQYDTPAGGVAELLLTPEVLDDIITCNGLVVTGDGYILNKITIE